MCIRDSATTRSFWVIVKLVVPVTVQLFDSVITTLYVPAASPLISCVVAPLLHKYVYVPLPPVTLRSMDPVVPPLHNTFTCVPLATTRSFWVIVKLVVPVTVQLFDSVITTLYVPAASPLISCVVAPLLHKYVYVPLPPVTLRSMDPVVPPLHNTFTCVPLATTRSFWVIVKLVVPVTVQLFDSVITTLYVPAASPLISCVVAPLLHKYVYVPLPPVTLRSMDPVVPPLHNTFTCVPLATTRSFWVIVKLVVPVTVQLFDSVITVSYTHLRAHETRHDLVCRLLLEKQKAQLLRHIERRPNQPQRRTVSRSEQRL